MSSYLRQTGILILALMGVVLVVLVSTAQAQQAAPPNKNTSSSSESNTPPSGKKPDPPKGDAKTLEDSKTQLEKANPQTTPELRKDKTPDDKPIVAGELIVTYKDEVSAEQKQQVKEKAGAQKNRDLSDINAEAVSLPEAKHEQAQEARQEVLESKKQALEQDPKVESVDYNYMRQLQEVSPDPNKLAEASAQPTVTVNDTYRNYQWGLNMMQSSQAWDKATGVGTYIAVLDSGVLNSHPDLNGAIPAQTPNGNVAEWDFLNGDANAEDDVGHGTHVAGIAGALTNNSTGIAGGSPDGWILDYKICGQNGCPSDAWIQALSWAADSGADVANMSIAGEASSTAENNAINYAWNKGTVVVAAAGNHAQEGNPIEYPAAYPNAISVAAVNNNATKSSYSNYNAAVDIAAPGGEPEEDPNGSTLSTVPAGCFFCYGTGAYEAWPGTSMATPQVAGVASLLASQGLSQSQIRSRLETAAVDIGPAGKDIYFGSGVVNAYRAVNNITTQPPAPPPPPTPPPAPTPPPTPPPVTASPAPTPLPATAAPVKHKKKKHKRHHH